MNEYTEHIVDDINIQEGNMLIKSITYTPRIFSEYIRVDEFSDRVLSEAKHIISKHMADMILNNMKYMEVHDNIRGQKEYRISVSVLMEQEKIDYLERIESLEQKERNLKYALDTITEMNNEFKNETLFDMIKRWWNHN